MEQKQTSVLSEEFKQKLTRIACRVRGDGYGTTIAGLFTITGFTVLLLFWWTCGKSAMYVYAQNWLTKYPGVPLSESTTINLFLFFDRLTYAFIIIVWIFLVIYVCIMAFSEKSECKPKGTVSDPPKEKSAKRVCPNCKSVHVRNGKGLNKGKNYCMTCRSFF
jgi:hypothetical protein